MHKKASIEIEAIFFVIGKNQIVHKFKTNCTLF